MGAFLLVAINARAGKPLELQSGGGGLAFLLSLLCNVSMLELEKWGQGKLIVPVIAAHWAALGVNCATTAAARPVAGSNLACGHKMEGRHFRTDLLSCNRGDWADWVPRCASPETNVAHSSSNSSSTPDEQETRLSAGLLFIGATGQG